MIDTHTHLNFAAFRETWLETVEAALHSGISTMIVVGTDIETSIKAIEMAQEHPALYASVGIHPHHAQALMEDGHINLRQLSLDMEKLKTLVLDKRVVAVGEVGLDYHSYQQTKYTPIAKEKDALGLIELQRQLFLMQAELAQEVKKPMILHSREADEDVLTILSELGSNLTGVFHCYEGSKKYLKKILAAGLYVSFTGNVTYTEDRALVALEVPLDRLLLETDSPYMTPHPHRGKPNTPEMVKLIAQDHARRRKINMEEIEKHTDVNAQRLFGLH